MISGCVQHGSIAEIMAGDSKQNSSEAGQNVSDQDYKTVTTDKDCIVVEAELMHAIDCSTLITMICINADKVVTQLHSNLSSYWVQYRHNINNILNLIVLDLESMSLYNFNRKWAYAYSNKILIIHTIQELQLETNQVLSFMKSFLCQLSCIRTHFRST